MVSLEARARRAYELGRLSSGLRASWLVAVLIAVALITRDGPKLILAVGAALFVLSTAFVWWGGAVARAVRPSLLVAFVPLILPMVVVTVLTGDACSRCAMGATAWYLCMAACVGGGIAAGAVVGIRAARLRQGRFRFVAAAVVLVSLGGSLGCALLGGVGVLGMVAGLAFGSIPVLVPRGAPR